MLCKNNNYSNNAISMPGSVLRDLQILAPLILTTILNSRHYYYHRFADEEVRQSEVKLPRVVQELSHKTRICM